MQVKSKQVELEVTRKGSEEERTKLLDEVPTVDVYVLQMHLAAIGIRGSDASIKNLLII